MSEKSEVSGSQQSAELKLNGKTYSFPVVVGSEGEVGIDIAKLRGATGAITLDPGYGNTGSCMSAITYIDGEKGILRYRGYPIEELAEKTNFLETAYLLIYGELPNAAQWKEFSDKITHHTLIHEDMKKFFEGYPPGAHPMAILSSMVASLSTYYPHSNREENVDLNIVRLLAKAATIAAFSYKKSVGQPFIYPRNDLSYTANFLHMMFAVPAEPYAVKPVLDRAISFDTDLYDALKIGLISMDSTMRSNLGVGLPIDILVARRDTCSAEVNYRIEPGEPYFQDLRERWSGALRAAHMAIPRPPYRGAT